MQFFLFCRFLTNQFCVISFFSLSRVFSKINVFNNNWINFKLNRTQLKRRLTKLPLFNNWEKNWLWKRNRFVWKWWFIFSFYLFISATYSKKWPNNSLVLLHLLVIRRNLFIENNLGILLTIIQPLQFCTSFEQILYCFEISHFQT